MSNTLLKYLSGIFLLLLTANSRADQIKSGKSEDYMELSILFEKSDIDSAIHYAKLAIQKNTLENNELQLAESHYQLAHLLKNKGDHNSSIKNSFIALDIFENKNDIKGIVKSLTMIGAGYSMSRDHEQAKKYFHSAIDVGEKNQQPQVTSYIGLGNVLYHQDSIVKAEEIYQDAIELLEDNPQSSAKMTASIFTNLGNIKFKQGDFETAENFYAEGYRMYETIGSKFGMCITSYNIGEVHYKQKKYNEAEGYFKQTLELGKEIKSIDDIEYSLQSLSDVYKAQGLFEKALTFSELYHTFIDSISVITHQKEVDELQLKYQHQKNESIVKEQEELLRISNLEKIKSDQQTKLMLWGILGLSLITGISIFSFLKIKKKNLIIQEAKLEIDQSLKEKDVLLKEIHHRVKNNLQMISSLLNLQAYTVKNEDAAKALEESKNRVQAIAIVHKKLYQNTNIGDVNLGEYILDLTQWMGKYKSPSNKIEFKFDIEDIYLNVDTIVPLGLIISELISNSQKHAFTEKQQALIEMKATCVDENKLLFEYHDNGIGLPKDFSTENLSSLGFEIIESLTEQLEGEISYGSENGMFFKLKFRKA